MREPASASRRLFIGLFPDGAVLSAILEHGRAWRWPPSRQITRRERLHMTLHFLGECDADHVLRLQQALAEVEVDALDLVLTTPQVWRNGCAVLLPDENAGLQALQRRIGRALERMAYRAPEGRWAPHITLARHAAEAGIPEVAPRIDWPVREFVLVWSRLSPVATYEVQARYPARA